MARSIYLHVLEGIPDLVLYYADYEMTAIGVTNRLGPYGWTWYIDSDRPRLYDVKDAWLIVRTRKGYHYYLDTVCKTFYRCLKRWYKLHKQIGDTWQIKLARVRTSVFGFPVLVIRVNGKYAEKDLQIVRFREPREVPPEAVKKILFFLNL